MDVIMDMIAKTDVPTDQVLIKANIIETTKSMARSVGIQWGGVLGRNLGSQNMYMTPGGSGGSATPPGSVLTGGYTPAYGTAPGMSGQGLGVNFPAVPIGGAAPASVGLILGNIGANLLEVQLTALQSDGKVNILSSPSLVTLDNQTASTENGEDVPYVTPPTQDAPATVTWKKVVLRLEITPHVIDRKNIKMTIVVKKDEVNRDPNLCVIISGYQQCPIFVKEIKTDLVVSDGETIVISGLTKQMKVGGTTGVPWFENIPVLGWLFKTDSKSENMEEVLIFITPNLIKSQDISEIQTGS
jgi:type IV pilus assembly protein PilQ